MKLEALIKHLQPLAVEGKRDREVLGIVEDSRQVRPGHIFVAVDGQRHDGWMFVEEAAERGAVAAVSEHEEKGRKDICCIRVADARRAVADLACAFYDRPFSRLAMVGITGTNGKTTTAYMIRDILRAAGREPGLITTVEYEIGPRTIPATRTTPEASALLSMLAQMVNAGCSSAVMEVSSHALVQKRTAGLDFDVAVFTNLTRDHLDYHKTMEEYFQAKTLLFASLGKGTKQATAVINVDDPWGNRLSKSGAPAAEVVTFGMGSEAMVRAEDTRLSPEGSVFQIRTPWGEAEVRTRLLGRFNVSNVLGAVASCGALGTDLDLMVRALSKAAFAPGRLEKIKTRRGFQVFVDYAHTDDALEHVLTTLREITANRLMVVFGCGGNRDKSKRAAMGQVAARLADYSILTSDNPRHEKASDIIAQIREGFGFEDNFEVIEDRRQAIERALEMADKGDVVLIAGKGHENFQEFANKTIAFDDRQVVRSVL